MRLIDADTLELDTEWSEYMDGFTSYSQFQIDNAPTIEAKPVRHGRWILNCDEDVVCNQCRHPQQIGAKDFCGKCGADMREEGADNG